MKFPKTAKPFRRRIYLACGHTIALATVVIAIASYYKKLGDPQWQAFVVDYRIVFWAEAVGIWAFAFSWLTKGKADLALARSLRRTPPTGADPS